VLLVVGLGVLVSPFLIMVDLGLPVTRDAGFQVYCMLLLAIGLAIHTLEKTAFGQRCQQLARSIKLTDDTTGSLRLLPLGAIAVVGSILGVLLVWTLG
jgi:hypothetical protein